MEVIKGVNMLDCTNGSHAYLIQGEDNYLIDTSFPGSGEKIVKELKKNGIDPKSIKKILLTHHDVDHIGNAKFLQDVTGAELWISKEDAPYITGEKSRPGVKRIVQTLVRYKVPRIDKNYSNSESVGNIEVIGAPGHTPGHVIFLYKNVLFTGDLFRVNNGKIKIMPRFMNWNHTEQEKSLGKLKYLKFDWLCPSHGLPIRRDEAWESFIKQY